MKKYITLLSLSVGLFAFAQISTSRMNEMRLGNELPAVEKALGKKLDIAKKIDDYFYTITTQDKGAEFHLSFIESENEKEQPIYILHQITTKSKNIKTLSNIGIGSSLDDLWKAYRNYSISLWNSWDEKTEKFSTKNRTFQLSDHELGSVIYFDLENDKVVEITVTLYEGC